MGDEFFGNVASLIEQARKYVGRTADLTMCVTYFEVGRMIVEEEQGGKARAEYGRGLLKELSAYLGKRFGKGFSESTLRKARQFYQIYAPTIQQSMITELEKRQTLSAKLDLSAKQQSMIAIFDERNPPAIRQLLISELYPFKVSWTHYLILIRIENPDERRFYEIEAANQQWTVRQLQRQYGSSLYERLALSRDKDTVMKLAKEGQVLEKPEDMLKNPLVLEFLGMNEDSVYSETELESA